MLNNAAEKPATLLLVDDEPGILGALRRLLRPLGYTVHTAESGRAGLEIMEREAVDLVISDMRMPEMTGAKFLELARLRWPAVTRILLTGHADTTSTIDAINRGEIYRYVAKPWDDKSLLLLVHEALENTRLGNENNRLLALTEAQHREISVLNTRLGEPSEAGSTKGKPEPAAASLPTGLPGRTDFMHLLADAIGQARRDDQPLVILHLDLDDFFLVNAAVGSELSDQVMLETARRLKESLRQEDSLARVGRDKFVILYRPYESDLESNICEICERLLAAIRKNLLLAGQSIDLTASIGVACYPADGESGEALLGHAVQATERTKALGGNDFQRFDDSIGAPRNEQRELLNELRGAAWRGEMVLHFQPQVSLFSGAIVGLEALIRWQHPVRGLLLPGTFIPLVEQSSQIVDIGEWVLGEACRQLRAWIDSGLQPVKVAINLAARHFRTSKLPETIAAALDTYRIEARLFEIEVTEGVMMHDVATAIRSMEQLKTLGIRISLDDFGTGYSSLAYLSRFPIDVIKIDQSFVSDITINPVNAAIAQATIAMSHKLGKLVLAEGVETEEQMQYLRRNECDEMQGYYFSKPCTANEITRMLSDNVMMSLADEQKAESVFTVLLVDDEPGILSSLKRTLRREGYSILTAESAEQGLSVLAKASVQVIISDQRMPGMKGTDFLSRVKSLYPETIRMVLSGYSEISSVTDAINKGAVFRFLLKPWDDEQLKLEIHGAFRQWRELYGSHADKNE